MDDPIRLVDAFEATIRAVILNERLRNPESMRALQDAKDDLVRVLNAAPSAVAPVVASDDWDRRRRARNCLQARGEVFLKSSIAPSACAW